MNQVARGSIIAFLIVDLGILALLTYYAIIIADVGPCAGLYIPSGADGIECMAVYGHPVAFWIPLIYSVVFFCSIWTFIKNRYNTSLILSGSLMISPVLYFAYPAFISLFLR